LMYDSCLRVLVHKDIAFDPDAFSIRFFFS
jgi:hypothetical protein